MENNFLLYFFAFAFLIAWSGVVVCSVYSFIRSMKKDIENHSPQINKRGVEYDDNKHSRPAAFPSHLWM